MLAFVVFLLVDLSSDIYQECSSQLAVRIPFGEHVPNLIYEQCQLGTDLRWMQILTVCHTQAQVHNLPGFCLRTHHS